MRAGMVAGLRSWRDSPTRRAQHLATHRHDGWSVEAWRSPLGVVGFVFEGRPNVFADATGVLRTGNTVVFRIGSDALGTARAIVARRARPRRSPPPGCRPARCSSSTRRRVPPAGRCSPTPAWRWPSPADPGPAVAQLGAVARQHGVPVSLHGTGGAWLVAAADADADRFAAAVEHSLDRKVCNTLNVCCVVAARAGPASRCSRWRPRSGRAARRGVEPIVHRLAVDDPRLATEWEWDDVPEVALVVVDDVDQAVAACNRFSPHFVASLISDDPAAHEAFYGAVDAPFVGDGFTRWVDGQFALDQPELGPVQLAGRPAVRPQRRALRRLGPHRPPARHGHRPAPAPLTIVPAARDPPSSSVLCAADAAWRVVRRAVRL